MRPDNERHIVVSIKEQRLSLFQGEKPLGQYSVSTALNGPGESFGSGCTPRGLHRIRIKIGDGYPINSVFIGRRPTGEIYTPELAREYPERDWILTRIIYA